MIATNKPVMIKAKIRASSRPSAGVLIGGSGSILCGSQSVRLPGASRAHRLRRASCGISRGLMLHFGVDLGADQDHDDGEPNPHHEADDRAERTVGLVVAGELRCVP